VFYNWHPKLPGAARRHCCENSSGDLLNSLSYEFKEISRIDQSNYSIYNQIKLYIYIYIVLAGSAVDFYNPLHCGLVSVISFYICVFICRLWTRLTFLSHRQIIARNYYIFKYPIDMHGIANIDVNTLQTQCMTTASTYAVPDRQHTARNTTKLCYTTTLTS
jgi:hypothetical protein